MRRGHVSRMIPERNPMPPLYLVGMRFAVVVVVGVVAAVDVPVAVAVGLSTESRNESCACPPKGREKAVHRTYAAKVSMTFAPRDRRTTSAVEKMTARSRADCQRGKRRETAHWSRTTAAACSAKISSVLRPASPSLPKVSKGRGRTCSPYLSTFSSAAFLAASPGCD